MTLTSVLFFSSKIEQSRIVTIHRPLVITQERRSPAFYVFRQIQELKKNDAEPVKLKTEKRSTYLSNFSLPGADLKVHIAEMKFNKKEFSSMWDIKSEVALGSNEIIKSPLGFSVSPIINSGTKEKTIQELVQSSTGRRTTIRGKLELVEGVGITDHYIELKRIEEGMVREIGRIDLNEGLYSIEIESTNGYLMVQIKDRKGFLIGEDRERLVNLQNHGSFYEGPFLRVKPPHTIAANPTLATEHYSRTNVAHVKSAAGNKIATSKTVMKDISVSLFDSQSVLENPGDAFANISRYSSTISRVFDPSRIYKNTTSIRYSGEKTETSLFTSKWVEGAVSYIADIQKIEFNEKSLPVIIGRIVVDGKPASNIEVQIETEPGIQPIYLDQFMIPSITQKKTSENGYFMFVGLEPDNYQVLALKENVIVGSQFFIAEEEAIAFQNISINTLPRTKTLRTFDAFTAVPVSTDIVLAEIEGVLEAESGIASFKTYSENSTSEYLVRTNNASYLPIRYIQNSSEDYIHLPMIPKDWLENIKTKLQLIEAPNTGIVVGFTRDLIYDVYLISENYSKNNIVYFNELGQITSKPVNGGGFVLYNVPIGSREIVLQEQLTEKIYSKVFNIKSGQASVTHFTAD